MSSGGGSSEVYLVAGLRTPIGRHGGILAPVRPDDLAAHVIAGLLAREGVEPGSVDEVILGCANQAGEDNRNVARMAALLAGLPSTVPALTVNRLCASGLDAVIAGARAIACAEADVVVAGGVESMSRAPYVFAKAETGFARGNLEVFDTTIGWRFTNPRLAEAYHPYGMGETAENVAEKHGISREDQDLFAFQSQRRFECARASGRIAREILPISLPTRGGKPPVIVDRDEHPRADTTLEKLGKLSPAFRKGGTVTAGNASGVNDGAAALLLMSGEAVRRLGRKPLARIVRSASAGVDPALMGLGPVPATHKVMEGRAIRDLDLVELNEAFAAQSLACIRELALDPARVNVNGGAIAIGHPLGMSGARLALTLAIEMSERRAKLGLATLCVGVGQGVAILLEGCAA